MKMSIEELEKTYPVKIKIPDEIMQQIDDFDEKMKKSHKSKTDNNVIGKLGEWGVYYYFKNKGYKVTKPNMNVINYSNDGFCDLSFIGKKNIKCRISVKSQKIENTLKYGGSWTVQGKTTNHAQRDLVLDKALDNDLVCDLFITAIVDKESGCVYVAHKLKIKNMRTEMFIEGEGRLNDKLFMIPERLPKKSRITSKRKHNIFCLVAIYLAKGRK